MGSAYKARLLLLVLLLLRTFEALLFRRTGKLFPFRHTPRQDADTCLPGQNDGREYTLPGTPEPLCDEVCGR